MSVRVLVVDDEPDVETLFRQRFRRETGQSLEAERTAGFRPHILRTFQSVFGQNPPPPVLHRLSYIDGDQRVGEAMARASSLAPGRHRICRGRADTCRLIAPRLRAIVAGHSDEGAAAGGSPSKPRKKSFLAQIFEL